MKSLEELRERINSIDEKMIELFQERMSVVSSVADYKRMNGMDILDENREKEVIKIHLTNLKKYSMADVDEVEIFLKDIMDISKNFQKKRIEKFCGYGGELEPVKYDSSCKVGFQGVPASFSHEALVGYFGDKVRAVGFDDFEDVFESLRNGNIDYGILPVENSSTGGISQVYDLLERYDFYIVGEKCIEVTQNLLGIYDSSIDDIEEVYSHSQAFLQSREFLKKHSRWKLIPYFNTAKSAEYVSRENNKHKASIASKEAAEFYGLHVLKENINYNNNNYTRFIIIGRNMICDKNSDKISILVALPHRVGSLYNILKFFWKNNLNMTKIDSRPIINKPWQYFFYIDFQGNVTKSETKYALQGIRTESSYFKLLGSYKED